MWETLDRVLIVERLLSHMIQPQSKHGFCLKYYLNPTMLKKFMEQASWMTLSIRLLKNG